jgi:hypothetical protein
MLRLSLVRPITAHLEHYQKLEKINYDSGLYWIWIGAELQWWFFFHFTQNRMHKGKP